MIQVVYLLDWLLGKRAEQNRTTMEYMFPYLHFIIPKKVCYG